MAPPTLSGSAPVCDPPPPLYSLDTHADTNRMLHVAHMQAAFPSPPASTHSPSPPLPAAGGRGQRRRRGGRRLSPYSRRLQHHQGGDRTGQQERRRRRKCGNEGTALRTGHTACYCHRHHAWHVPRGRVLPRCRCTLAAGHVCAYSTRATHSCTTCPYRDPLAPDLSAFHPCLLVSLPFLPFLLQLFNYPVVADDAPYKAFRGHASHVTCVRSGRGRRHGEHPSGAC